MSTLRVVSPETHLEPVAMERDTAARAQRINRLLDLRDSIMEAEASLPRCRQEAAGVIGRLTELETPLTARVVAVPASLASVGTAALIVVSAVAGPTVWLAAPAVLVGVSLVVLLGEWRRSVVADRERARLRGENVRLEAEIGDLCALLADLRAPHGGLDEIAERVAQLFEEAPLPGDPCVATDPCSAHADGAPLRHLVVQAEPRLRAEE